MPLDNELGRRVRQINKRLNQTETQDSFPASGAAPTGPASGDLTGTYPSPTIALGAVTPAKLSFDPATQAELDAHAGTAGTTVVQAHLRLATDGEVNSAEAVAANDSRLSNARTPTAHASTHHIGGSDALPAASTTTSGLVELATSVETTAGLAVQASDTRLSDDRFPTAHASTHEAPGADQIGTATPGANRIVVSTGIGTIHENWLPINSPLTDETNLDWSALQTFGAGIDMDSSSIINASAIGAGTGSPGAMVHALASSAATKGLIVQGAASQSANLAEYQSSAAAVLGGRTALGHVFVGTAGAVGTGVRVNKTWSDATGQIAGIDSTPTLDVVNNSGFFGVVATATYSNTAGGTMSASIAGIVAGANVSAATTGTIGTLIGFTVAARNLSTAGAVVTNAYGLLVNPANTTGAITNVYGIYISAQSGGGTLNYALFTNAGLVHFGDSVDLASGKNLTLLAGNIVTDGTTGTKIGTATTQKLALWNKTPIIQPAHANQAALTNSTGGTYDGTLAAIAGTGADAALNNNFTDIYTHLNEIRNVLVNTGIMKGAA